MLKKFIAAGIAASFVAAPVVAAAPRPASKLSVAPANVRAAAPMKRSSKAVEAGVLYAAGAVAAVVVGVVLISDGNDNKSAS